LVVEDEKRLAASLKRGLEADGFAVDVALDGTAGKWMAIENEYDAIVLDIMLPGVNGFKLCGELREAGNRTPILMLTVKDGELDETAALDTGADHFLRKAFSHLVLVARIRALLRRGKPQRCWWTRSPWRTRRPPARTLTPRPEVPTCSGARRLRRAHHT
jgi:DNA-binding response OmpR family regulator